MMSKNEYKYQKDIYKKNAKKIKGKRKRNEYYLKNKVEKFNDRKN